MTRKRCRSATGELKGAVAEFEAQLDLCFESGKEDLARNIIRKKLETERLLKRLDTQHAANAKTLAEQRATLEQNSATLESLRQKAELFAQRTPTRTDGDSEFDDIAWMAREMNIR